LLAYESQLCPNCGNYKTLVPLSEDMRYVRWDEYGGRRIEVNHYRCLTCASAEAVRRAYTERHAKDQAVPGQAAATDGLMVMAKPVIDEEVQRR
jgi:hypothetical protein